MRKIPEELNNDDIALILAQLKVRMAHVEARFDELYNELQKQNEWLREMYRKLKNEQIIGNKE